MWCLCLRQLGPKNLQKTSGSICKWYGDTIVNIIHTLSWSNSEVKRKRLTDIKVPE